MTKVIFHFGKMILHQKLNLQIKQLLITGGYILTIVPNKFGCFDYKRSYTTFEHILNDYNTNIDESDLTHLEECLSNPHPYKQSHGEDEFKNMCLNNSSTRIMHNHVFDIDCITRIHEFIGFKTIYCSILPEDGMQLIYFGKLSF